MSNLNEDLQKAADVCFSEQVANRVRDIMSNSNGEKLTTEQAEIKADEYITRLIFDFYEPHKHEMPIDTFKYLMTLPKEMRTFAGYGKVEYGNDCEIKIG